MSEILTNNESWLLTIVYSAHKNEHESERIIKILTRHFRNNSGDIFYIFDYGQNGPYRMKPLGELADDCFYTVTFFEKRIKYLNQHRGSPNEHFYVEMGRKSYRMLGYDDLAEDWDFWRHYLKENILI